MTRTRLIFNSREEWLAARNEGIGASEVASVLGLNPWETPYQLWLWRGYCRRTYMGEFRFMPFYRLYRTY